MQKVVLKAGKEKSLLKRHPWIFSGAIASMPQVEPGTILPVFADAGEFLAQAYFNPGHSLVGRVLSFSEGPIEEALAKSIAAAIQFRTSLFNVAETNAYRLINGEADGIPGLIVDLYGSVLVLQAHTAGIERLKPILVPLLRELTGARTIFERSNSASRKQEGLEEREGLLWGEPVSEFAILENGIAFQVSIDDGQKSGFFLDQRKMRKCIGELAKNKRVLNCFSYSGGFSIAALRGGALSAVSIDVSAKALELARKNTLLNGLDTATHELLQQDVFTYLEKEPLDFDLVILDPPAFAKKREDVQQACSGYKRINRLAFEKLPPGSLLLTCSCSYFIDLPLFQNLLFQAALEAKRDVKIVGSHHLAADHPISLYHPEGSYLKSLLLYIA